MKSSGIIIVPQGGIANRLRAIASAYQLGIDSNREVRVIWTANSELNADPDEIINVSNLPFEICKTGHFIYNLTYEIPRKKNFFISSIFQFFSKKKFIFQVGSNPEYLTEDEILKLSSEGERELVIFSGLEFYNYDASLISKLFKITDEVEKRISEILKHKQPVLGLHIRRTDNKEAIENSPLELFEEEIKKTLIEDKGKGIFLASDDQDVKLHLSKLFPDNIIYNSAKAETGQVKQL